MLSAIVLSLILILHLSTEAFALKYVLATRATKIYKQSEVDKTNEIIAGIGDEGCALPSPSGINMLSPGLQLANVIGVCAAQAAATVVIITGIHSLELTFPGFMAGWLKSVPILGVVYAAAGVAHFTLRDEFVNIMPRQGAWGIWYLPGTKKFHVEWTGAAELVLGLWLAVGGIDQAFHLGLPFIGPRPVADSAALLLALTILITPANIYMYTHGAKLPMTGNSLTTQQHAIRFSFQAILFALFFVLAEPSLIHVPVP